MFLARSCLSDSIGLPAMVANWKSRNGVSEPIALSLGWLAPTRRGAGDPEGTRRRDESITVLRDLINESGGWILDFKLFSNISICINTERKSEKDANEAAKPNRTEFLSRMGALSSLLNDAEYFAAFRVVQAYHLATDDK